MGTRLRGRDGRVASLLGVVGAPTDTAADADGEAEDAPSDAPVRPSVDEAFGDLTDD